MDIWLPDIPVWEVVIRSLAVFAFLLVVIRLSGKRDMGEMSPSDLILLLLLTANVHTSLAGADKSVLGGLIGALALVIANYVLNRFAFNSKKFERVLKGRPEVIIFDGEIQEDIMKKHLISKMQVKVALRKEGVESVDDVRMAVLEPDGEITVFKREHSHKIVPANTVVEAERGLL